MNAKPPAQERARAIWRSAKSFVPSPPPMPEIIHPSKLILEDYQASGRNGHWAHVTCEAHEDIEKVIEFVQNKTGLSRWMIKVGSPHWRNEKWNWWLLR